MYWRVNKDTLLTVVNANGSRTGILQSLKPLTIIGSMAQLIKRQRTLGADGIVMKRYL